MRDRGDTFKIFIGNLSDRTSGEDLRKLFEQHGTVLEADVVSGKYFGFVHMEKEEESKAAIEALNGQSLDGREIAVAESDNGGKNKRGNKKTKIFIGNLHKDVNSGEIRELFEVHGKVTEADVLTNFAFVHMESEDDARTAIESIDGTELHGLRLRVQESTSRDKRNDDRDSCNNCGRRGHWARECRDGPGGSRGGRGGRFDPYGGGPPRGYDRDRMMRGMRDDPYDRPGRFDDGPYSRRPMRDDPFERFPRGDPYDRRPLPLPPRMRDDPYDRRPIMPPMRDDPYERRRMDYMSYGRRSPPPRGMDRDYGDRFAPHPPPPPMRGYLPAPDRR